MTPAGSSPTRAMCSRRRRGNRHPEPRRGRRISSPRPFASLRVTLRMSKTYFIETWGCQMNDLDSQRLSGNLKLRGYRRVDDESQADLILLNTCSIRDKAEQKVFSHLGRLRELKEQREGLQIGVCGCVAQQEGEAIR